MSIRHTYRSWLCLAMVLAIPTGMFAQIGGKPGAFSRMGFGGRGIGMGNAMTAVASGELVGYYNPAVVARSIGRTGTASFGLLSLDRSLNFVGYTMPLPPQAGLSAGIINAGVSDIDGRDADGEPTGMLKTSENQVFLSFGVLLKNGLSLGINLKLYHYHLYTDVNSTTVGIDFGMQYAFSNELVVGATLRDVNSRYSWDTGKLLGQEGQKSDDKFPLLYTFGGSYRLLDSLALLSAEVELSNVSTAIARFGVEVPLMKAFTLRAGVDRIDLKEQGNGIRPAGGFTARTELGGWSPALTYAFVLEPFSSSGMHIITLSALF